MICCLRSLQAHASKGEESYVNRALDMELPFEEFRALEGTVKAISVTPRFKDVIQTFHTPAGETPAGFRRECELERDGLLQIDLVRDISYDKNGRLRPTQVLYSADSADPYEVASISPLISNLTCNPGIIYDLFLNNPAANVGGCFHTREEVLGEIGRILGPGCDISVELNNPFEKDFSLLLEEAEQFREMFSDYRVVIKVPHTGAVTPENVAQLMEGDRRLDCNYTQVQTAEAFRGHLLALKLREHGFRVNFTLMFEPYQTQLALQARPYFINTFLRHRLVQSDRIGEYLGAYGASKSLDCLRQLRAYLVSTDYLSPAEAGLDLCEVLQLGESILHYRHFRDSEGSDGLDGMRHNLRVLKNCNLPDTRLIVCSMEGEHNYPDIDKLLCEPEFMEMNHRVVITATPNYLARFTSANQVTSYQRRFMNAVRVQ